MTLDSLLSTKDTWYPMMTLWLLRNLFQLLSACLCFHCFCLQVLAVDGGAGLIEAYPTYSDEESLKD